MAQKRSRPLKSPSRKPDTLKKTTTTTKSKSKSKSNPSKKKSRLTSPTPSVSNSEHISNDGNSEIDYLNSSQSQSSSSSLSGTDHNDNNNEEEEPDYILAEIENNNNTTEIITTEIISKELLLKIISEFSWNQKRGRIRGEGEDDDGGEGGGGKDEIKKGMTKISKDSLILFQKYITIFIKEGIKRCELENKNRNSNNVGSTGGDGWLELEDLEHVAVQLCLDF